MSALPRRSFAIDTSGDRITRRQVVVAAAAGMAGGVVASGAQATAQAPASSGAAAARGDVRRGAASPLVVWFTVEGAKAMRRIAARFTADTGVEVVIETPDADGPSKFQQAAAAGKGPDLLIYAHDRIGEWISGGLLHAVTPPRSMIDDIHPLAWKGFAFRGRLWGYPLAIEAITLIHNRALVPEAPRSFEEVFEIDARLVAQGRRAILWDYTNNYFTWPLMAAHGGYAFKPRADGGFDPRDTGVNNAGALTGARLLERLIRQGLMPVGSGYPEMEAAMAQQRVAMMINGPWSWVNLKRAGIRLRRGTDSRPSTAGRPRRSSASRAS